MVLRVGDRGLQSVYTLASSVLKLQYPDLSLLHSAGTKKYHGIFRWMT